MTIGGIPSMQTSVLAAMNMAGAHMDAAAEEISAVTDDPGGYVDASMEMSLAKLDVGIAAKLSRTQDDMLSSTLDMLA